MPTPVLLVDSLSGVRIGEERWNVRRKAVTGATGVSCACHFLSRVFLDFFHFFFPPFAVLRPVFACPHGQLCPFAHPFPRILALFPHTHHTPSGPLAPKVFHSRYQAIRTLSLSGTVTLVYPESVERVYHKPATLTRTPRARRGGQRPCNAGLAEVV